MIAERMSQNDRGSAPLGGGRSPRFIGEMLRVGESRSSLDPRGMEWSDSQSNRSTRITQNTRSEERDSIPRKDETYRHSMPENYKKENAG